MKTARSLLTEKGHPVWAIAPSSSVYEALNLMAEKDIGALLVMEQESLVGIFSERDYARKMILKGKNSKDTLVKEIMTTTVVCVEPQQTIHQCMALMTREHIRHLPVVEDNRVVGMVSMRDVVQAIIVEHQDEIERLEDSVMGREPEL